MCIHIGIHKVFKGFFFDLSIMGRMISYVARIIYTIRKSKSNEEELARATNLEIERARMFADRVLAYETALQKERKRVESLESALEFSEAEREQAVNFADTLHERVDAFTDEYRAHLALALTGGVRGGKVSRFATGFQRAYGAMARENERVCLERRIFEEKAVSAIVNIQSLARRPFALCGVGSRSVDYMSQILVDKYGLSESDLQEAFEDSSVMKKLSDGESKSAVSRIGGYDFRFTRIPIGKESAIDLVYVVKARQMKRPRYFIKKAEERVVGAVREIARDFHEQIRLFMEQYHARQSQTI